MEASNETRQHVPGPPLEAQSALLRALGWAFSGCVAVFTLTVFCITLRPVGLLNVFRRPVFRPPPVVTARPVPVQVAPMELPPAILRQTAFPPLALPNILPSGEASRKMTVAVLDLAHHGRQPPAVSSFASYLKDKLARDGVYAVVDRKANADAVILISISADGSSVSSRMVESSTGRKLRDTGSTVVAPDPKDAAIAVGTALERPAFVKTLDGPILTLDTGCMIVRKGDRFVVTHDARPIGKLLVIMAANGLAAGRYSGEPVQTGDQALPNTQKRQR